MQSTTKRHTKARKRLSLVFLYLPFLLMQLSYKFFIVANLYFYVHHQSQVMLQVDMSHELQNANKKGGAHEKTGYYVTHLSIDKRYSHKVFTDNSFCDDPIVTAIEPVFVIIKRHYCAINTLLLSSDNVSCTSRGPPCA